MFEQEISVIGRQLQAFRQKDQKAFVSSSFQSHSLPLLHIISRLDPDIPVYFLNTGYHFPETITFKEQVAESFGLKVFDLKSAVSRHMQRDEEGKLLFASDPDYCCYLNKVQPLEPVLAKNDIWITGVRKDQNDNRGTMESFAEAPFGARRYHPMLNFSKKDVYAYMSHYDLPRHPLDAKGYWSIGCEPCTQKMDLDDMLNERSGRWEGMNKSECGLHTDLIR